MSLIIAVVSCETAFEWKAINNDKRNRYIDISSLQSGDDDFILAQQVMLVPTHHDQNIWLSDSHLLNESSTHWLVHNIQYHR